MEKGGVDQLCVGHTAWAPKGREGWSQEAWSRGPEGPETSSLKYIHVWRYMIYFNKINY